MSARSYTLHSVRIHFTLPLGAGKKPTGTNEFRTRDLSGRSEALCRYPKPLDRLRVSQAEKKLRSREMSARSYALHSVRIHLAFSPLDENDSSPER